MICESSHILGIEITTFFRKMNHGLLYTELTLSITKFVIVPTLWFFTVGSSYIPNFFSLKLAFLKKILLEDSLDEPVEIYGKPFGPFSEILP
ncbi:hypothetical protein [Leptospira kirschneri]|uniref:Uncharacterized protein n=1 Tax=Leptospira kirschneri str. H1 TaxID=1049966 RepID=A0A0E2BEV7_9LEPT|nr:hypothetical protein [Leptospira kirschneri]EKO15742.1 hypothetical protein LEP1GSC081_3455 [Leptospira kirschneri str. H1]